MEADAFPTRSKDAHSRRKRQAPYIIFPEILCIVDYDGYRYVFCPCMILTIDEEIQRFEWVTFRVRIGQAVLIRWLFCNQDKNKQ